MKINSDNYDQLFEAVMQLPKEQRLVFGHDVISSVMYEDVPPSLIVSHEEIMQRAEEALSGKAKMVDAFESLDRLEKKYRREAVKAS
jgi:hypothetical protein